MSIFCRIIGLRNAFVHRTGLRSTANNLLSRPRNPIEQHKSQYASSAGEKCNDNRRVVFKAYVPPPMEDHDYKNMRLKRPMSPHLTVLAPTLVAMISIVQRGTGIIASFYMALMAYGALVPQNGVDTFVELVQRLDLTEPCIVLAKFLIALPFVYHYIIGIRFCMWNLGKWLDLPKVYFTGKLGILLAFVITLAVACDSYIIDMF